MIFTKTNFLIMILQISTLEEIESGCQEIQDTLKTTVSDDANECVTFGIDLSVLLARSSKMIADAKFHKDEAVKNSIVKEVGSSLGVPASILKMLIDASCKRENYLVNWCERLNASLTHSIDFLRTVISKQKAEMQSFGNNRT